MIIDEKGKLFGKVSIIDIVIILVVLAGAAGLAYKFTQSRDVTPFGKNDKIEMVFYVTETPDYITNSIKAGDKAKELNTGVSLGTVKEVSEGEALVYAIDQNGEVVTSVKPDHYSLRIVVEGNGVMTDGGAAFSNATYPVNKSIQLQAGKLAVYARLIDINTIKE